MTEAEFNSQRATINRLQNKAADLRREADELDRHAMSWLMDLLKVADQEPWWGEAND